MIPDEFPAILARVRDIADGDSGFERELCALFVSEVDARIGKLTAAIVAGDPIAAHAEAHALKGASSNVGALHLAQSASTLERCGDAAALAGAPHVLRALCDEFEQLRRRVALHLEESPR